MPVVGSLEQAHHISVTFEDLLLEAPVTGTGVVTHDAVVDAFQSLPDDVKADLLDAALSSPATVDLLEADITEDNREIVEPETIEGSHNARAVQETLRELSADARVSFNGREARVVNSRYVLERDYCATMVSSEGMAVLLEAAVGGKSLPSFTAVHEAPGCKPREAREPDWSYQGPIESVTELDE